MLCLQKKNSFVDLAKDGLQLLSAFSSTSVFSPPEALENSLRLIREMKDTGGPGSRKKQSHTDKSIILNREIFAIQSATIAQELEVLRGRLANLATEPCFGPQESNLIRLAGCVTTPSIVINHGYDGWASRYTADLLSSLCDVNEEDKVGTVVTFGEMRIQERYAKFAGWNKAIVIDQVVKDHQPKLILEFGAFVGWSAHKFIQAMNLNGISNPRVITVEANVLNYALTSAIVQETKAPITVLGGWATSLIPHLNTLVAATSFDLIFFDHKGTSYRRDLELLENAGYIKHGTVLIADNALSPGAPQLLEYLHNNPNYETYVIEVHEAMQHSLDWMMVSVCKRESFATSRVAPSFACELVSIDVDRISWKSQADPKNVDWEKNSMNMLRFVEKHDFKFSKKKV